jgi:hypothetical protein
MIYKGPCHIYEAESISTEKKEEQELDVAY